MNNGNIELLHIDCMEYMKTVPDKFFDLAIVDPPYGIGESGKTNKTRSSLAVSKDYGNKSWDNAIPDEDYFINLFAVSKNVIIWGANNMVEFLPNSTSWVVWDKQNGENDFADCELAYTSFDTAVRKFAFRWQGMLQGNMANKENRIHPTQKPVALYKWLLKNYAKEGDKIFDSHMGSGSIAIACHDYKFSLTACEIDKDYYDAACKRFKNHVAQTVLF